MLFAESPSGKGGFVRTDAKGKVPGPLTQKSVYAGFVVTNFELRNTGNPSEVIFVVCHVSSGTIKFTGWLFPHNLFCRVYPPITRHKCHQKRNGKVFYRAWKGLFSIIHNTRIDMTAQKITTFFPPPGHAARVARNRYLRDHATRIKAIAAGKAIYHFIGRVDIFTRQKLSAFLEDEKACNAKLKTFLQDVDSCSIGHEGWLREGAYRPIHPGPFCPVQKKKD